LGKNRRTQKNWAPKKKKKEEKKRKKKKKGKFHFQNWEITGAGAGAAESPGCFRENNHAIRSSGIRSEAIWCLTGWGIGKNVVQLRMPLLVPYPRRYGGDYRVVIVEIIVEMDICRMWGDRRCASTYPDWIF